MFSRKPNPFGKFSHIGNSLHSVWIKLYLQELNSHVGSKEKKGRKKRIPKHCKSYNYPLLWRKWKTCQSIIPADWKAIWEWIPPPCLPSPFIAAPGGACGGQAPGCGEDGALWYPPPEPCFTDCLHGSQSHVSRQHHIKGERATHGPIEGTNKCQAGAWPGCPSSQSGPSPPSRWMTRVWIGAICPNLRDIFDHNGSPVIPDKRSAVGYL